MVSGAGWPDTDRRPPKMKATFDSTCPDCGDEIEAGQTIYWSEHNDAYVCSLACK